MYMWSKCYTREFYVIVRECNFKRKSRNIYFSRYRFFLMSKILMYTREWNFKRKSRNIYFSRYRFFLMSKILMYTREWNFKRKTYVHTRVWRYIQDMVIPKDPSPAFGSFLAEGRLGIVKLFTPSQWIVTLSMKTQSPLASSLWGHFQIVKNFEIIWQTLI